MIYVPRTRSQIDADQPAAQVWLYQHVLRTSCLATVLPHLRLSLIHNVGTTASSHQLCDFTRG